MGKVARYLGSLDDAGKDRILRHEEPTYDGKTCFYDVTGCRCLVVIGEGLTRKVSLDKTVHSVLFYPEESRDSEEEERLADR